ncbi:MAG: exodeoxyribonuclease VII large subunit [Clostridia bacterium]|nr:exodeoxyribonuclease VII large subunit [Clostridia bacterium]
MLDKVPFLQNAISVTEVNLTIKACMDSPIFKGLLVFGEVSGFKFSGPHAYFTLKDKQSQISCVCFNAAKTYQPKDGEGVIVKGSLDYYVKGGRLSLQVTSIEPAGMGALALEFEKLKAKLTAEGLFDEAHKKPIPEYVKNVLVVTSKTGAVIRDIVTTVRRKNPIINIVVKDVRVQGEEAGHEIAKILPLVDALGYDVIIIARGGGSLEDLAPFYDEELVRAVYAMKTPVVSAVGHETDFSLCDFVADARAATPTAAGELIAFDYYAMIDGLKDAMASLKRNAVHKFEIATTKTQLACKTLLSQASDFYTGRAYKVTRLIDRATAAVNLKLEQADAKSSRLIGALDNLSPLKILKRGYFRLERGDATVSGVAKLKVGDKLKATGSDGYAIATVESINLNKE